MQDTNGLHTGRTIVVAGGTGSVGRVLTAEFLRAGATVVVPSRSPGKVAELRTELDGDAPLDRLVTVEGDIGDDTAAPALVERIRSRQGPIHGAVATLGRFVPVTSLLEASLDDLREVIDGYLIAHFVAARALLPAIEDGGSYTLVNGPLAFRPMSPQAALVSTVTAAQAMLARVLMDEVDARRVNEVVLYTPFGWDDAKGKGAVDQDTVARYVCHLAAEHAAGIRGRSVHLDSREPLEELIRARQG